MPTAFERRHPFAAYRLPALLFAAAIFIMSSIPGDDLPPMPFISFDKIVHALEFGLLGMLLYRAFRFPRPVWRPYVMTLAVGIPYAALDELHQRLVPGRYCSMWDFVMDAAGLVLFAGMSAWMHGRRS